LLGLRFKVVPSRYIEPPAPDHPIPLADFVTELALHKAREVASRHPDAYVLGADTLVTLSTGDTRDPGVPLGKPADAEDAGRMLRLLSARTHRVLTGVALLPPAAIGVAAVTAAVETRVTFRTLSDTMIADYVATGEPLDKAGAYGAQGYAAPFISGFEGDFYNVVGLPLCTVGTLLERVGVEWWRYRHHMPAVLG
jgi:septum formation protein